LHGKTDAGLARPRGRAHIQDVSNSNIDTVTPLRTATFYVRRSDYRAYSRGYADYCRGLPCPNGEVEAEGWALAKDDHGQADDVPVAYTARTSKQRDGLVTVRVFANGKELMGYADMRPATAKRFAKAARSGLLVRAIRLRPASNGGARWEYRKIAIRGHDTLSADLTALGF
jgi:hypothetical protein